MADPDIEIQRPAGHANAIAHTGTDDLGSQPYGTPIVLTYTIANVGIEIDAFVFPDIDDGTAVNVTMTAQGGIGAQSWSLVAGALPGGLVLESNGQIHGTVDTPGSFNWTLQVSDSEARTDQHTFSMVVNAGTWSEELRTITDFSAIWSMDDESMRTVTGSDIDSLKETGGDARFDLAYVSGTKPTVGTRDDVTVIKENAASVVFRAGASGTLANLWASGKGTVYVAGWFKNVVLPCVFFRSGDGFSYGFEVSINDNTHPRAYLWDGGNMRTALSPDSAGEGWHQLCVKVDGTNLTLYVDGVQKAQVASGGGVGYLDGVFRLFFQSIGHEIAVMAFGADNATHDDTTRNAVEDKLRELIAALP